MMGYLSNIHTTTYSATSVLFFLESFSPAEGIVVVNVFDYVLNVGEIKARC